MASRVLDRLGKDAIIDSVGTPFEFFRLYASCIKDDEPSFNENTVSVLNSLEKKYVIKRK
jgi:hypothetical protein